MLCIMNIVVVAVSLKYSLNFTVEVELYFDNEHIASRWRKYDAEMFTQKK